MAKTTHTHKGHCQACGRLQAADNNTNLIAKHGYRVAGFGFFVGTCKASDELALEKDRTVADRIIVELGKYAKQMDTLAAAYKSHKVHPKEVTLDNEYEVDADGKAKRDRYGRRIHKVVKWEEASERDQDKARQGAMWGTENEARNARDHITFLQKLIASVHGKPLTPNKALTDPPLQVVKGMSWTHENGTTCTVGDATRSGFSNALYYVIHLKRANGEIAKTRYSLQAVRNNVKDAKRRGTFKEAP